MPPRKKANERAKVDYRESASPDSTDDDDGSDFGAESASAHESSSAAASDASDNDSDDLDADSSSKKRKKGTAGKKATKAKKQKASAESADEQDDDVDSDVDEEGYDKNGRKVLGTVVKAPTTGLVPPGRLSQNTLEFMKKLAIPANNHKEWFSRHEPVYRVAQKEWYAFINHAVERLIEIDDEIPFVKANDVAHRINRDVRFSSDKTPYKRNLSMSISRSGRKGIFAHYHLSIMPNDRSMAAFGLWDPQKNELANMRAAFSRKPKRMRKIINHPDFVKEFGEGTPLPPPPKKPAKKRRKKGESDSEEEEEVKPPKKVVDASRRRNVFGRQDELKVAPKGYAKDDPNIDLLRLRSVAVTKMYSDESVMHPDFLDEFIRVAKIARPLIHYLNDIVTLPDETEEEDEGEEDGESADEQD